MVDVFEDVIGHGAVVELLRHEALRPAQAYLFVGPESAGKAHVARRFAAAMLGPGDADVQRRVLKGAHPDVVVVEPDGRTSITVDQARSTVSQASLAPLEAERKIFLLEEGGILNDEAANALLKTLEEPSPSTIFLIVAESEDDLPDTVASRCRTVVFGRVDEDALVQGLARRGVETDQAEQVVRIAGGRPGLAVALATQPDVAEFRRRWLAVPLELSEHPGDAYLVAERVAAAADPLTAALRERHRDELAAAEAEGAATKAMKERHERALKRATAALFTSGLEILAGYYRDVAAAQVGAAVRNPDLPATALTRLRPAAAVAKAERVLDTVDALRSNQRPQLALAALFADLGQAS